MTSKNYKKRAQRVRRKIKEVNVDRFRLTVFRSSKNISAQIIDDKNKKTLVYVSSNNKKSSKKKKGEKSLDVAKDLAKKALEKKITKVYFDRGGYKYHGRIKSFVETVRKEGLTL